MGARQELGGSSLLGPNGRWGCRERVARRSTPYAGAHRRKPYTEVRAAYKHTSEETARQTRSNKTKQTERNSGSTRGSTQLRGSRVAIIPLLLPLFVDIWVDLDLTIHGVHHTWGFWRWSGALAAKCGRRGEMKEKSVIPCASCPGPPYIHGDRSHVQPSGVQLYKVHTELKQC